MKPISPSEYAVYRSLAAQTDLFLFDRPDSTVSRITSVARIPNDIPFPPLEGGNLAIDDYIQINRTPGELEQQQFPELHVADTGDFVLSRVGFSPDEVVALVHVHCHVAGYYVVFRRVGSTWHRELFHGSFIV